MSDHEALARSVQNLQPQLDYWQHWRPAEVREGMV
jgi:hypothetical protein